MWQFFVYIEDICSDFMCMANTLAEKLVCQFLCGKQKLSVTSICSCIWLVTYLSHVFYICTFVKLCAIIVSLLKPIFCVESKNICCIIYTSNRICHGKLSNTNCSCKRGLKTHNLFFCRKQVVTSLFTIAVDKLCSHWLFQVVETSLEQAVNNLQQAWWNYQTCYKIVVTRLIQSWNNNIVTGFCSSQLRDNLANNSDTPVKFVTSCQQ